MKILTLVGIAAIVGVVCYVGCSKESRDEAINRLGNAGRALNGEVRPDDVEHGVPNVVSEQQRKERIRQNTQWTAENRALHPIEYCQAQLEELQKHAAQLEVTAHEVACKKAEVTRMMSDDEGKIKSYEKFLTEAKAAYRQAETNNTWPVKLGGFSLSKDKVREKIVDAAKKIPTLQSRVGTMQNQLNKLEKKAEFVTKEQKTIVLLREKINTTIGDLKLKKVLDGEKSITDALNAISDQMGSLGVDNDDPSLDDIVAPDRKSAIADDFDKIMAQ